MCCRIHWGMTSSRSGMISFPQTKRGKTCCLKKAKVSSSAKSGIVMVLFELTMAAENYVVMSSDRTKMVYKLKSIQLEYEIIRRKTLA